MNKKVLFIGGVIYFLLLKYMLHILFPFLLAIVFFLTLKPIIDWFEKVFHIQRSAIGVSLLLVIYVLLVIVLGILFTYMIIYSFEFINHLPLYYQEMLLPFINQITTWLNDKIPFLMNGDNIFLLNQLFEKSLISLMSSLSNIMSQIPGFVFSFFIFVISTFFLFVEYDDIKEKIISYSSLSLIHSFIQVKNQTMKSISVFMKCQLILMFISFIILYFGFSILHIEKSLLFAVLTALLDSLPFIGVGVVLIPMCILYLFQKSYLSAFYIFLVYLIINVIRSFLEPQIMNKQIKVPAFILLISMTIHLYFFGIIGIILSPIHMNLLYCLLDYYQET